MKLNEAKHKSPEREGLKWGGEWKASLVSSCLFLVNSLVRRQYSRRNWGSKRRYSEETALSEKGNSKYKASKAGTNLDYSLKNIC